jgi:hypothetical protein
MSEANDNPSTEIDYYMVAGQVAFLLDVENAVPQAMALNTLLKMPHGQPFNARAIGVMQQSLQAQAHRKSGAVNPPKFLDVVILSIMPLGCFADGEFEAGSILDKTNDVPN